MKQFIIQITNLDELESKVFEARYNILGGYEYINPEDIVLYIPQYIQREIAYLYPLRIPLKLDAQINKYCDMEVLDGYENAIIVTHKEAALRNIPIHKIEIKFRR